MADLEETDKADLENIMDAVLQVAQHVLRDRDVRQKLLEIHGQQRVAYWRVFFQVVLSNPFGRMMPGDVEWESFREQLVRVRDEKLEKKLLKARIQPKYEEWRRSNRNQHILYAVAQFWNADDLRAPAFVVNEEFASVGKRGGSGSPARVRAAEQFVAPETWDEYWQLMNEINTQESKKEVNEPRLAPVSIGNFIVRRSHEMNETCSFFQLHVGPRSKFEEFKKELLTELRTGDFDVLRGDHTELLARLQGIWGSWKEDLFSCLEIPDSVVCELLHESHTHPRLSGESLLFASESETKATLRDMLKPLGPSQTAAQAKLVAKLAQDDDDGKPVWEAWHAESLADYLEYVRCFFLYNYYSEVGDRRAEDPVPPRLDQLRLILLNNLLVARSLLPKVTVGKADGSLWHYQYFIPTWHKSTSYLAVVTRRSLSQRDLDCLRKFAERLFGLAWAHDSTRKLEEDKAQILVQTERAARAAILARNFSHTVGSHVLNSPGFAMALTRGQRGEDFYGKAKGLSEDIDNLYVNKVAITPREFLAQLERYLGDGQPLLDKAREVFDAALFKTTTFHRFLQGRFDFIARAIEDRPHAPEPVFFVEDLMEGFVSQTVFLDHLVKDLGWRLQHIRFHLYLPSEKGDETLFQSRWTNDEGSTSSKLVWEPAALDSDSVSDYAALIGLPGGSIGAHAFYAVLENVIRNSFKYGLAQRPPGDETEPIYTLSLRLMHSEEGRGWRLQMWDNFSTAGDPKSPGSTFSRIKDFLSQDIVDSKTGELKPEGLGIKEMALCARSLFAPRHGYAAAGSGGPLRLIAPSEWRQVRPSAGAREEDDDEPPLVYEIALEEPVLLAIYNEGTGEGARSGWIRRYASLSELGRSGAHIAVLPGDLPEERMTQLFQEISDCHPTLPHRLLIVCASEGQKAGLEALLRRSRIPPRRAHCFCEQTEGGSAATPLYDFIKGFHRPVGSERDGEGVAAQHWIRLTYEAWLRAWKGKPEGGKWHLCVGFERPADVIAETWGKVLHSHKEEQGDRAGGDGARRRLFRSDIISVVVKSKVGDQSEIWLSDPTDQEIIKAAGATDSRSEAKYWKNEFNRPYSKKRALVFDNHGTCFTSTFLMNRNLDYRTSVRFFQQTSGGKTFELFQRLSNIPSNPFGFSFFIYNLVESCLTVVAVADERVAADLLFSPPSRPGAEHLDFIARLAEHQKAGVFPLFQLRQAEGEGAKVAHYSLQHGLAFRKALRYQKDECGGEGIWLTPRSAPRCMLKVVVPNMVRGLREEAAWNGWPDGPQPVDVNETTLPIDFLLVHEGAVDMFRTNNGIEWDYEVTMTLFDIAPGVVRTSGRGRHSRNLGEGIPFLEASALTAALVTSRNKYELARALLGSVAENGDVAEKDSQV